MENYVPWFCNVYTSSEYLYYDSANYIPVICRIDPHNPEEYIDKSIGGPNPYNDAAMETFKETFYNRLLDGIGDWDSDGMPDEWERQYGLNPLIDDSAGDLDGDGLTNVNEYKAGTYPNDVDSDGDGMPDGWEVQYGLNPLIDDSAGDLDGDRSTNLEEYLKGTIPNDPKSRQGKGMPWLMLLLNND